MGEAQIRAYMDELFADAPNTHKALDMKLEFTENLIEKYRVLVQEGKSEEEAYKATISGIGDVSELFVSLEGGAGRSADGNEKRLSAVLTAFSVMLYIISLVPLVIFRNTVGLVLMLICVAVATGTLVLGQMLARIDRKADGTMVEQFMDWQSKTQYRRRLQASVSAILWCLVVVLYFTVSFSTMAWHLTWLVFPLAAAFQVFISLIINRRYF